MEILSITKKGNYVEILTAGQKTLLLKYETFLKSGLRKGDELSEEKMTFLLGENDFNTAKEFAFRCLAKRIHSEKELRQKLAKKFVNKVIIDKTIEYLFQNKYLDDGEFARKFFEEKMYRYKLGWSKIRALLISKGIQEEIIKDLLPRDQLHEILMENAVNLASKKYRLLSKRNLELKKIKQRLYTYLGSKGYSYDQILEVFRKMQIDEFT